MQISAQFFAVESNQLLAAAQDAGFGYGRPLVGDGEATINVLCAQNRLQYIRRIVLADKPQQRCPRSEACQVHGYVCSTTGTVFGIAYVHNRHWRFRRNPAGTAKQVTIQHDIAGNQYTGAGKIGCR